MKYMTENTTTVAIVSAHRRSLMVPGLTTWRAAAHFLTLGWTSDACKSCTVEEIFHVMITEKEYN